MDWRHFETKGFDGNHFIYIRNLGFTGPTLRAGVLTSAMNSLPYFPTSAHFSFLQKMAAAALAAFMALPSLADGDMFVPDSTPGFFKATDPKIPKAVRKAASSVFMIAFPIGPQISVRKVFGNRPIQQIISSIYVYDGWNDLEIYQQDGLMVQLKECAKIKKPLDCLIQTRFTQASAFVMGDGRHLRMTFHSVALLIKEHWQNRETQGFFSGVEIPLFIYDYSGNKIYSPEDGPAHVVFPTLAMALFDNRKEDDLIHPNRDVVDVELSAPIALPLRRAQNVAAPGEPVYHIGYPTKTTDRFQYGAPDAPGGQLRVSMGEIITPEASWIKHGGSLEENCASQLASLGRMTLTSADGGPGMSGGPTLNAKGEVLGTFTAVYPAQDASKNKVTYSSAETGL